MDFSSKLSIISLNNIGVSLMMDDHHDQAIKLFNSAIDLFAHSKEASSASTQSACASSTEIIYCDQMVYCAHADVQENRHILSIPSSGNSNPHTTENSLPSALGEKGLINVFQLPLFVVDENLRRFDQDGIPQEKVSKKRIQSFSMTRLDFIITYNLALCYHLFGLKHASNDMTSIITGDALLNKAAKNYEAAYNLLMQEPRVIVARVMVILNNAGQVHRQLNNDRRAVACFERLLTTMLILHQNGDANRIEHWDSFVFNVCGLMTPRRLLLYLPAAAA